MPPPAAFPPGVDSTDDGDRGRPVKDTDDESEPREDWNSGLSEDGGADESDPKEDRVDIDDMMESEEGRRSSRGCGSGGCGCVRVFLSRGGTEECFPRDARPVRKSNSEKKKERQVWLSEYPHSCFSFFFFF